MNSDVFIGVETAMVRISKQQERRHRSPRRPSLPAVETGSMAQNLSLGYKPHDNALAAAKDVMLAFVPKIKSVSK
jgi:hypothetical protein